MAVSLGGQGMSTVGRVRLADIVAVDGLQTEQYRNAVSILSQSLQRFNAVVIQLTPGDDVLLRCVLDSVRMFFHHRAPPGAESVHSEDPQDWNRTAGYFAEPQHMRELFDYRPGRSSVEATSGAELAPFGLPELFAFLGKAARSLLDAIACSLELRSFSFTELLDNVPLRPGEVSTSVLSACCYGRPGVHSSHGLHALPGQESHMPLYDDPEPQVDKGLLTLMKSDKPGLQIRDLQGRWTLVDADLGPHEMVLYSGLTLFQATAGYLLPALHKTETLGGHENIFGRCYISFKLMPRATAILHCGPMTAAGHNVGSPYSTPLAVQEFMQRTHSMEQLMARSGVSSFAFPPPTESLPAGTLKASAMKRRKQVSRGKPLAPSKQLRLEAQRVLKERVQEIADTKGLKIKFCNFKECEEQHINSMDSPCSGMRVEMGWPPGVPFVHPHDLPNKAKQAFLEAYEPGWTDAQDRELASIESGHGHGHQHSHACKSDLVVPAARLEIEDGAWSYGVGLPVICHHSCEVTGAQLVEDDRFCVRTVYEYLRTKGKQVPTGKLQVVSHEVDLSGLARASYDAGGRAQFEARSGFEQFIKSNFQLENPSDKERERALVRLREIYDFVLADYVEELVCGAINL